MKLTVTQDNFKKALSNIGRVATYKTELDILKNILLRTDGNRLLVAATNLEIASTQYIGAKVEEAGSITVPAKLITDFIASLPNEPITLEIKNEHLHITTDRFSSIINGVAADEFPELPAIDEENSIKCDMSVDGFKKAVEQTIIATSSDMSRAILTGVYWHSHEEKLYLAATDGYRLAQKKLFNTKDDINAVVPASALQEVVRSLNDNMEQLSIFFDDTQVAFRTEELEIISKLVDGKFPDYQQLIPSKSDTDVSIKKSDFSRIVKVASLFARESGGGVTITANEEDKMLLIHSIASELGENTSEAAANISSNGQITLNSRYLIEALNILDGEETNFSFSGKLSPCILSDNVKNTDYIHIIMPLKS